MQAFPARKRACAKDGEHLCHRVNARVQREQGTALMTFECQSPAGTRQTCWAWISFWVMGVGDKYMGLKDILFACFSSSNFLRNQQAHIMVPPNYHQQSSRTLVMCPSGAGPGRGIILESLSGLLWVLWRGICLWTSLLWDLLYTNRQIALNYVSRRQRKQILCPHPNLFHCLLKSFFFLSLPLPAIIFQNGKFW